MMNVTKQIKKILLILGIFILLYIVFIVFSMSFGYEDEIREDIEIISSFLFLYRYLRL